MESVLHSLHSFSGGARTYGAQVTLLPWLRHWQVVANFA